MSGGKQQAKEMSLDCGGTYSSLSNLPVSSWMTAVTAHSRESKVINAPHPEHTPMANI